MTRNMPESQKMTCAGRSPLRDGSLAVRRRNLSAWLTLALLAAVFIAEAILVLPVQGEDRKTRVITFLASGLKSAATVQSTAFDVSAYAEGQICVDVTAEAGTSTLDVIIQTSPDGTTWYTHTVVGQITATGQTVASVTNFGKWMRINYTVGGTSMTFSVVGQFKN
ncbi:MAG: DUF6385 domain-containing protein [Deltaproteobacteria bacterium]|nr:DUF6385 domain-containing protein [Deltaproteobacteria bacterium]